MRRETSVPVNRGLHMMDPNQTICIFVSFVVGSGRQSFRFATGMGNGRANDNPFETKTTDRTANEEDKQDDGQDDGRVGTYGLTDKTEAERLRHMV